MTTEEKARAYDEAIERANELNYVSDKDSLQRKTVEHIFPELKESKGERIRNFISNELACLRAADEKGTVRYNELTEAIDWVEKQGEQKPAEEYNITSIGSKNAQGKLGEMIKNLKLVNEVLEQKSWSEEDEKVEPKFGVGDIIRHKDTNETFEVSRIEIFDADEIYYHLTNGGCICENSDNFERVEQNPAWGEEDKNMLQSILDEYKSMSIEKRNWLKSLKDKVLQQQKQEWSEEDEEMHRKCICAMRASACGFPEEEKFVEQVNNWFISLKNKYTCKSSEELMDVLKDVKDDIGY
jgi:hypothetical protein